MSLEDFIINFPAELGPLRDLAMRLDGNDHPQSDDVAAYGHRPKIAPQAFALRIYPPLGNEELSRYQMIHSFEISPHYLRTLSFLSGVFAFNLSLFGLPRSMLNGLISRSTLQPYDLATANRHWKYGYSVPDRWFHFGGGSYSDDKNVGYFFDDLGAIHSALQDGSVLASWQSFHEFLQDELSRSEALFLARSSSAG